MRFVSLTVAGLVILAAAATAAAARQRYPGWPSSNPVATYMPGSTKSGVDGTRKLLAQRAANMINQGDCKGALRMVLRESDYVMADRIVDVCHLKV
jgi:hypothetical protein